MWKHKAYGMEKHAARAWALRKGVPAADTIYQCMRVALKTLTENGAAAREL